MARRSHLEYRPAEASSLAVALRRSLGLTGAISSQQAFSQT